MALPKTAGPKSAKAAAFMRKAVQYYEAGDLAKSQKNVSKYLSTDPRNPDANHLAGLIAHNTGQSEQAVKLISRALESNPRIAMAHNNLGEAYRELEQFGEAEASYRKAIELEPQQSGYYNNLSIALLAQEQAAQAIEVCDKALNFNPRDPALHINRGNALSQTGNTDQAIAAYKKALAIQPSSVEALSNLGLAYQRSGDLDRASEALTAVLTRSPQHISALGALASIHEILGNISDAEDLRERAITVEPDEREHYLAYADFLRFAGRPDESVAVFERYLKRDPKSSDSKAQIASTWRAAGEQEKAEAYLRDVLKDDPDCVAARTVLAQMIKHTPDEENISGLSKLYDRTDLPDSKRSSVCFSLGKAMEETGDYDRAIKCYEDGNACERKKYTYTHEATIAEFDRLVKTHTAQLTQKFSGQGSDDTSPIFIIGMPRSGTSLVEQIISSHSQVMGAGELSTLAHTISRVFANNDSIYPDALPISDGRLLKTIGDTYVELTRKRFGDAPHITDKLPHNFLAVGMIRLALPNAKIIHCRRHPMDTCLSIYKNNFSDAHHYAYNMEELGLYYREYLRLMDHWRDTYPGAMHEIIYENLVADTEAESRALIAHCGLDWEPACLEFYKTKRVVNTVSSTQVRQPIYKSSVALWKQYGERLRPLMDALGDALPAEDR